MPEKAKMTERDQTLINILERLADQIHTQDQLLEEILSQQRDFSKDVVNAEFHRSSMQKDTDISVSKLREMISHYRSDMLSIVNEQDYLRKSMDDVQKTIAKTNYALEKISKTIAELDDRTKSQDKTVREHYEHSLRDSEVLPREASALTRHITKMHADSEKLTEKLHRESQRQVEKLQQDTTRRLLALDGIEASLQTLLIRTEPPEKKPLVIVRVFKGFTGFFRYRLPVFFRNIRFRIKGKAP
jgi:chromosome segregation ATPase